MRQNRALLYKKEHMAGMPLTEFPSSTKLHTILYRGATYYGSVWDSSTIRHVTISVLLRYFQLGCPYLIINLMWNYTVLILSTLSLLYLLTVCVRLLLKST